MNDKNEESQDSINYNFDSIPIPKIKSMKNKIKNEKTANDSIKKQNVISNENKNIKKSDKTNKNNNHKKKEHISKKNYENNSKENNNKAINKSKYNITNSKFEEYSFEEKFGIYDSKMLITPIINNKNYFKSLNNQLTNQSSEKNILRLLNYNTIKETFNQCSSFPKEKRKYIWQYLLSLSNNKKLFDEYKEKKIHPFYKFINDLYPLASPIETKNLQTICSLISHWSASVGNIYFLPYIVFPFIKVFPKEEDNIFVFETIMAVFASIGNFWFEYYPGCPLYHLKLPENIIKKENPKIYQKIKDIYNSSCIVQMKLVELIWRLIRNLFSESVIKEQWLTIMDFLICYNHKPEMILYLSAAYILKLEKYILKATDSESLKNVLFEVNNSITLSSVFKHTLVLYKDYNRYQLYKYKPYIPLDNNEKYLKINNIFPHDYVLNSIELEKSLIEMDLEYEHKAESYSKLENKYKKLLYTEKQIQRHFISEINKEHEKDSITKHELDIAMYNQVKYQNELLDRKIEKLDSINESVKKSINILHDLNYIQKGRIENEADIKREYENNILKQRKNYQKMKEIDNAAHQCLNKMADLRNKKANDIKLMEPVDIARLGTNYLDNLGDINNINNPYGNDEYYSNLDKRRDFLSIQDSVIGGNKIDKELKMLDKINNEDTNNLVNKFVGQDNDGEQIKFPNQFIERKKKDINFEDSYENINEEDDYINK